MWEGDLEIGQENLDGFRLGERIGIIMRTQQCSINNSETFDWASASDVKVARFSKHPKSCLKKKNDLKHFIKNSHILKIEPQYSLLSTTLLRIMDKKSCGLLELVSEGTMVTPLIVIMTQNSLGDSILAAFCVDSQQPQVKMDMYSTFRKLFRENVKYNVVKNVVNEVYSNKDQTDKINQMKSTSEVPADTYVNIDMIKDKISTKVKDLISTMATETYQSVQTLIVEKHATWKTVYRDQELKHYVIFVNDLHKEKEYIIFSEVSAHLNYLPLQTSIEFHNNKIDESAELLCSENEIHEKVKVVRSLSSLEQYLFRMGSEDKLEGYLVLEAAILTNILEQFETKHNSKVIVINKLNQDDPFVFCSIEPSETWSRIAKIEEQKEELTIPNLERKSHNPDEIIDGRPKWSAMKVIRDGGGDPKEENFDFDRLNPHRTFIQEFEDQFDNSDWVYNNTVLKMLSDLNSETVVVLGNTRLDAESEKKHMTEYLEWQKYKRENKHTYPHVKLKKLKADKLIKTNHYKIIAKNLRKSQTLYI